MKETMLVTFATNFGSTQEVAEVITQMLREQGQIYVGLQNSLTSHTKP